MSQKEVVDNVKLLESIEEIMQPVRLEYVQLKRSLDAIQMKYDNILYEHEEDLDQTELTVENQVKAFLKSHLNFHFTLNEGDLYLWQPVNKLGLHFKIYKPSHFCFLFSGW